MSTPTDHKIRPTRYISVLVLYGAIILMGSYLGNWITQSLDFNIWPHNEPTVHILIVTMLVVYIILTALPFVPGVELGLALIMVLGAKIVIVIYFATVCSLTLAFLIGRLVPERLLAKVFHWLGMEKAANLVMATIPLDPSQRVAHLMQNAPKKWIPVLLKYRFWALAILFNLPGSSLLGGGGGIAMAAGMSRLIAFPKFVFCVILAVSPVPIAILISTFAGKNILG